MARLAAKDKRALSESHDCLALLNTHSVLFTVQPAALCATLSAPPQVSARGCGALSIVTPFPLFFHLYTSSLLPFPPHAAASRSGAPTVSSFIWKKKSENAATCDTHRSTRTAQHELRNETRQEAAAVGANAESEGAGKARQCKRSELCDGRLKEKERGGRGGQRKGGGQGGGVGRRSPSQGAAEGGASA